VVNNFFLSALINFSHVSEVSLVYNNHASTHFDFAQRKPLSKHVKPADRPKISGSGDPNRLFRETWDHTLEHHESFRLMLLNRSNRVLGITTISTGGIAGTVTDIRIIFQYAI
jgi:DNA repair protein RadC